MKSLPPEWFSEIKKGVYSFQKTYPDGTDVIISIGQHENLYELKTNVQHRCFGPNSFLLSKDNSLDIALSKALREIDDWEKKMSRDEKFDLSKVKIID